MLAIKIVYISRKFSAIAGLTPEIYVELFIQLCRIIKSD